MSKRLNVPALQSALDNARARRGLSWRGVGREAGVSQSTLSRLSLGKRPDVDGYLSLLVWMGEGDVLRFAMEEPGDE